MLLMLGIFNLEKKKKKRKKKSNNDIDDQIMINITS